MQFLFIKIHSETSQLDAIKSNKDLFKENICPFHPDPNIYWKIFFFFNEK